ncbi:hypothetical protein BDV37DRAFT_263600 [Aspergillus pseudonomiae]|uniref:Secreted protein n=1 Tax=Aspergillus pseudonomiae TaxID=1506151 RepID=A0A5N7CVW0_9EURO|nr:uncharacterized protein BDV37DRAFT_263600 [Aspergillus pseudonomiae]KAE8398281.1 hypothetical protein BDV37DRAFT_263600 [Aspergillus pseudonomiae]
MDPRWPHGGRSTSNQLRICLLLGIASCTPPHPSSFSTSGPSLPPARACAFWVAPPAHAGHSSRSGLSCHRVCVSSSSLQTHTMPGCGLV